LFPDAVSTESVVRIDLAEERTVEEVEIAVKESVGVED
jgi:glucose-6-phosphate 1-dehydrogenase